MILLVPFGYGVPERLTTAGGSDSQELRIAPTGELADIRLSVGGAEALLAVPCTAQR